MNSDNDESLSEFENRINFLLVEKHNLKGKNLFYLIDLIRQYNLDEILSISETEREKGYLLEKIYDLILKCGYGHMLGFKYDHIVHYTGDIYTESLCIVSDLTSYLNQMLILGGSRGKSDITMKINGRSWIFISCKFYNDDSKQSVESYDVAELNSVITTKRNKHLFTSYQIHLCVNDKNKVRSKMQKASRSKSDITVHFTRYTDNIHEISDLLPVYQKFREALNQTPNDLLNQRFNYLKNPLVLLFHQKLLVSKTLSLIKNDPCIPILWGWKPRSGKTYGTAGLILELTKLRRTKFLIITPAPTETIHQFLEVFLLCQDFYQHKIYTAENLAMLNPSDLNIIILSEQFLQGKMNHPAIQNCDLMVFDENHYGGTTELSEQIINHCCKQDTIRLFLTATYCKPKIKWNIPDTHCIYWELEDEMFCKNRDYHSLKLKHEIQTGSESELQPIDSDLIEYD